MGGTGRAFLQGAMRLHHLWALESSTNQGLRWYFSSLPLSMKFRNSKSGTSREKGCAGALPEEIRIVRMELL
jgi:hypothetical protein